MKPLPAPVVTAAQRIAAKAAEQCLSFARLRDLVHGNHVAVWDEWATFHLRETVDFKDGTPPADNFIGSFTGVEMALHSGAQMLMLKRALEQAAAANAHTKITHTYALVMQVRNHINDLHAWLDCETGRLQTGRGWPALMGALARPPK